MKIKRIPNNEFGFFYTDVMLASLMTFLLVSILLVTVHNGVWNFRMALEEDRILQKVTSLAEEGRAKKYSGAIPDTEDIIIDEITYKRSLGLRSFQWQGNTYNMSLTLAEYTVKAMRKGVIAYEISIYWTSP